MRSAKRAASLDLEQWVGAVGQAAQLGEHDVVALEGPRLARPDAAEERGGRARLLGGGLEDAPLGQREAVALPGVFLQQARDRLAEEAQLPLADARPARPDRSGRTRGRPPGAMRERDRLRSSATRWA